MARHLLHGTLLVTILEIDRLNGGCGGNFCSPGGPEKLAKRFLSHVKRVVLCAPEVVGSRLYATIDLEKARVGRTRTIENNPPRWNESFCIYCAHMVSNVIFTVKNDNPIGATLIGRAHLPVRDIINGYEVDKWVKIVDEDGIPILGGSSIHVKVQFVHVTRDGTWSQGMNIPGFIGVPRTFFKQRQGCKVVLYQDAHVPDDELAEEFKFLELYDSDRCWEDIFDSITHAKHLIYITGWSVYTKITLIRDPRRPKTGGDLTLGDLLIKKANEGVRVLMLVWDDRTSVEALKKDGLMATHDQETSDFFRDTNVRCVLCPRNPDDGDSVIQGFQVSTMFTHHQKTVIVDAEIPGETSNMRRIVSFLGGIDLCDGRYDTREHHLFWTLNTVHNQDFHQPNFPGSSIRKGGPREPWHDIHCRLEGPVAWDVLYNFEQRWLKQAGRPRAKDLFSVQELQTFTINPLPVTSPEDPQTWNVQVLRSIDGGAVLGFPEDPTEAAKAGLVTGKDNVIERSIQDAYINAIRRAKNFIYIENQYFLGSSFDWEANDIKVEDINALHLIPKELSLKIISKIEAGERFTVYVVIPMWPEGIPESPSVQAILDWQSRTMEMMYKDIAQALKAKGLNNVDLREYLTFFCLGNREAMRKGEYIPPEIPDPDTDYSRAQQARRFMIYVHAKMMIVDDEYIIVGSANINQRSMDGGRDSEIAIGAYQPKQLEAGKFKATNKIFGFRVVLWQEHLNALEDEFEKPESLDCVKLVNRLADENWGLYTSDNLVEDLRGHLLRYPVNISSDGFISALPGFECFPDTKARVLGSKSELLPAILTT